MDGMWRPFALIQLVLPQGVSVINPMRLVIVSLFNCFTVFTATVPMALAAESQELFDPALSQWEVFMGVPHETVTSLPAGTFQSKKVTEGTPMGLGNDPKKVFGTTQEGQTTVLRVSGEIYGGLTTKASFQDYHLTVEFRWGDRKWAPRTQAKRDSGLLYHCRGEHGAFWKVWKSCLEYQVQETDLGDLYPLAGTGAQARFRAIDEKNRVFDASAPWGSPKGSVSAYPETDRPHGEWNLLEIYTLGDSAIHLANGKVVLALRSATLKGKPGLNSGQIQIQSEGAECFYRNLRLTKISGYPANIAKEAGITE
jgi:hypothetical protein